MGVVSRFLALRRSFLHWLIVAADPFHRITRGAHVMLPCATAWPGFQSEVSVGVTPRALVLQPGVCGALQSKYWKAASPGPVSGAFSDCRAQYMLCSWCLCGVERGYCFFVIPGS